MKPKMIWANLAVADVERSMAFYTQLGFRLKNEAGNKELACVEFAENAFVINFFQKEKLEADLYGPMSDTRQGNEVIFSLSAESEDEVKEWTSAVLAAGGTISREAGRDRNGYYVCVFADPDGHKFNILLMEKGM